MTIMAWITFSIIAILILGFGIWFTVDTKRELFVIIAVGLTILILGGLLFYFNGTAAGKRELVDQKSNISGIERTINVYTANGDLLASYEGKIDIAENDGGYVKFDFEGKRYIYYNCFVETIADID